MARYFMTYLGGDKPATPEDGKRHFAKYQEWLASLGKAAISPMNPFKTTNTIDPEGNVVAGSSTTMSGFTILEADSMDTAMGFAKTCPFLEIGGTIEISELMKMPG